MAATTVPAGEKPAAADLFARNREWHRSLLATGDTVLYAVGSAYALRSDYGLTEDAWPKVKDIAEETVLGVRTVARKVWTLVALGFMKKNARRGCGPNAYGFDIPTEDTHTLRLRLAEINARDWSARSAAQDRSAPCGMSDMPHAADPICPERPTLRPDPDPIRTRSVEDLASSPAGVAAHPVERTPKQGSLLPEPTPTSPQPQRSTTRGGSASPPASAKEARKAKKARTPEQIAAAAAVRAFNDTIDRAWTFYWSDWHPHAQEYRIKTAEWKLINGFRTAGWNAERLADLMELWPKHALWHKGARTLGAFLSVVQEIDAKALPVAA